LGVFGDVIGQKLQRDKPVQGYILCLIDNTHAAATELLGDAVVRNGLADQGKALALCAIILWAKLRQVNALRQGYLQLSGWGSASRLNRGAGQRR